jgi:hypothetical protein
MHHSFFSKVFSFSQDQYSCFPVFLFSCFPLPAFYSVPVSCLSIRVVTNNNFVISRF